MQDLKEYKNHSKENEVKKQLLAIGAMAFLMSAQNTFAQKRIQHTNPAPNYIGSYTPNYKNEVDLNLSNGAIHSYKVGNSSNTDINAFVSYRMLLQDHIQVGGEGGFTSYSFGGSSKNLIAAMGVFTYNFDSELKNSLFVEGGAGLYPAFSKDTSTYDSKFSFFAGFGKRYSIWDHVNYKPLFRIAKYGDQDMEFLIQALNISLMF